MPFLLEICYLYENSSKDGAYQISKSGATCMTKLLYYFQNSLMLINTIRISCMSLIFTLLNFAHCTVSDTPNIFDSSEDTVLKFQFYSVV